MKSDTRYRRSRNRRFFPALWFATIFPLSLSLAATGNGVGTRRIESLNGRWEFLSSKPDAAWKSVLVPAPFEAHEGLDFDGHGIYRKRIARPVLGDSERVFLHFQGVATDVHVRVDGNAVGSHLGGWTPFRCDITEAVRSAAGDEIEIEVEVDERVGHNSQGFLPVFAPHFGGIWQEVQLLIVPAVSIDDRYIVSVGDVDARSFHLELPLRAPDHIGDVAIAVRYRLMGSESWSSWWRKRVAVEPLGSDEPDRDLGVGRIARCDVPVARMSLWNPEAPHLYEIEIVLSVNASEDSATDRIVTRAAFRTIETDGDRLLLNGRPVRVRGLLNWGYAPPRNAPSLDEAHFRKELELLRAYGFNAMKFCLWVPPKRYLELCDEMGILAWMEYPTWHSKWTADQRPTLRREFAEFFAYDRNHPSVVLRSLTCETGPQADLQVITELYRQCHAMIRGAVVEDDSSWIQWNRVHDFYDDHPYGNHHTWAATLARLKQYIAERTAKPLMLGECIAADTWVSPDKWRNELASPQRPFWLPRFLEDHARWLRDVRRIDPFFQESSLADDAARYAWLARKYQIEVFHREVPRGGYVVSVIRDIPLCAMGLLDYAGKPKWPATAWRWHGDRMLLLQTPGDRRSFGGGTTVQWSIWTTNDGPRPTPEATLTVTASAANNDMEVRCDPKQVRALAVGERAVSLLSIQMPHVDRVTPLDVTAKWLVDGSGRPIAENHWRLWVFPSAVLPDMAGVTVHESVEGDLARELQDWRSRQQQRAKPPRNKPKIFIARQLTPSLWRFVREGGRLLLLPNGERHSLPLADVWFLRGGPWVARHPVLADLPREALVDLQAFDLAGPVVPEPPYWRSVRPLLMLWQNHDLDRVQTQGIVFDVRVESGWMWVSALHHTGDGNAAGRWLLARFLRELAEGVPPQAALEQSSIDQIADELRERRIELMTRTWQFRVDPDNRGVREGWHREPAWEQESWREINIGSAWESQGYPNLDGWAWYRLNLQLPDDWPRGESYLVFRGVDDCYDVFLNGHKIGSGGDLKRRRTAFDERKSFRLPNVSAGDRLRIDVRVYDWYGAGGIHRPVWLSTTPDHGKQVLK